MRNETKVNRRDFIQLAGLASVAGGAPIADAEDSNYHEPQEKRAFVHPGVLQRREDLDRMKTMVLGNQEPVAAAWQRLTQRPTASLDYKPTAFAHVYRGGGGIEKSGADEFSAAGQAAHFHALQWYVTKDARHAEKAIEVLDVWSTTLWDFDGNDAKLLVGWVAGYLCNAAEILSATYPSWSAESRARFRSMLKLVFIPLLEPFFPEANGNWDGAMMFSLAAVAIHLDDSALFDRVIQHYQYGVGNGGILKYLWPNGQCAESTRDQGHTQLGIGYFSFAAHVCWNQGVDLFAAGDNRMALGFEYTSAYMLGEEVPHFGVISPRLRGRFDDYYEAVLAHFQSVKHIALSYTERAAEKSRQNHAISTVWFYRGASADKHSSAAPQPGIIATSAGAEARPIIHSQPGWLSVTPQDSLEDALASIRSTASVILLQPGVHEIKRALRIPSGVTICGYGLQSVLHLDSEETDFCMIQREPELRDVVLKNFVIEGALDTRWPDDPNQVRRALRSQLARARGGILLRGEKERDISNVQFEHLTVRNCTMSGISMAGAVDISLRDCDISNNAGSVPPGAGLHHNVLLNHVERCNISGSRFSGAMCGSGVSAISSSELRIWNTELCRNQQYGLELMACRKTEIRDSLTEANDCGSYTSQDAAALTVQHLTERLNGHDPSWSEARGTAAC